MSSSTSKLFQPTRVGRLSLAHRIVFAPTTRMRGDAAHVPLPHVADYYEQRASTPGSLLISEATFIAAKAAGYRNIPGIWSDDQIAAWKKVVDRVHAKGSYMFLQMYALGRAADASVLAEDGFEYVGASDVPITGNPNTPRPITTEEIQEYIQLYATAASNAVYRAGFDGVEIHAANGYILDQFLHDRSNTRTDEYGGSPERRTRFVLEVADAVVKAVGQERTGLRVSPWSNYNDMFFADPKPTYTHLVSELRSRFPKFAYLHVIEPRIDGTVTVAHREGASNDFIREIWLGDGRQLISAGGYTRESGMALAETGELIAFGRAYLANPDLPFRLLNDIPLAKGIRALYERPGSTDPHGYTDYPFASKVSAIEVH